MQGEISNCKHHGTSGHIYFTLKDEGACIDCVMFRSDAVRLKFTPNDGMELLATGRVAVYPQRGRYQLYVTSLQPMGLGALELAFQQLRAKLEAEGLFDPERKKPLPPYPMNVALVTGRATAALQDMLKVLRRFPWVKLYLYDVPVQGDGSAEKIAEALGQLSRHGDKLDIDLILLGRGGGSLEDLWEFNEEIVARAIVASRIPVVTGIGHEVDVSIADLSADYHAHTPTEAAQVAMGQWRTAGDEVDVFGVRLRRALRTVAQEARQRLAAIERHEVFRRPMDRINAMRQLLDDRQRALVLAVGGRLHTLERRVQSLGGRLEQHHPRYEAKLHRQRLGLMAERLNLAMQADQRRRKASLEAIQRHLEAIGPEQVLKRGYTITTLKKQGTVVRSAAQVRTGDRVVTRFADGEIESRVEDSKQLSLFE